MPQSKGGGKVAKRAKKPKVDTWDAVKHLAVKAWDGVKFLKEILNAELKKTDFTLLAQPVSYNGYVQHLSNIAQGTSRTSRNGISIYAKSIFMRGTVQADDTPNTNHVRLMVVMDTMNTGTTPTGADVLDGVGAINTPFSPLKQTSSGRFKVLWSKIFALSKVSNYSQVFKAYIPLNKHIKYTGTLGTDEQKNQIYLMAFSGVAPASGNEPTVTTYERISFYDN